MIPIMLRSARAVVVVLVGVASLATGCASAPPGAAPQPTAPPAEPRTLDVDGPFRHASGLVFPERLGDFVRVEVEQFPGSRDNVGVSYELGPRKAATVTAYVYPAGEATLDMHSQAVVIDLYQHHGVKPYQASGVTLTLDGRSIAGNVASFAYEEPYGGGPKIPLRSHAYVFTSGKWVVKYRVTNPAAGDDDVQARVRGLVEAIGFP